MESILLYMLEREVYESLCYHYGPEGAGCVL